MKDVNQPELEVEMEMKPLQNTEIRAILKLLRYHRNLNVI